MNILTSELPSAEQCACLSAASHLLKTILLTTVVPDSKEQMMLAISSHLSVVALFVKKSWDTKNDAADELCATFLSNCTDIEMQRSLHAGVTFTVSVIVPPSPAMFLMENVASREQCSIDTVDEGVSSGVCRSSCNHCGRYLCGMHVHYAAPERKDHSLTTWTYNLSQRHCKPSLQHSRTFANIAICL